MVLVVGRAQHLGLVDEVHAECFENLCLDEVADAGLGHDRDLDGVDDASNHVRVGHAGHAALCADVSRNALQCHNGGGSCVLGDLGLFRGDDVHDDATLQLVGKTALDARGTGGDGRVRRSGLGCLAHVVIPVSSWLGVLALPRLSPRVDLAVPLGSAALRTPTRSSSLVF